MKVRLYAALRVRPKSGPLPIGLHGERITLLKRAGFSLAVGDARSALEPTPGNLVDFDRIICALADVSDAILPARFGVVAGDVAMLKSEIADRADVLARALDQVTGRVQMTLRLPVGAKRSAMRGPAPSGPGARYLRTRAADAGLPALTELRPSLAGLVREERIEQGPRWTSVYHLIDVSDVAAYRARVAEFRVSGPFPPYAFVPGIDRAIWPAHDDQATQSAGARPARPRTGRRSARNTHR